MSLGGVGSVDRGRKLAFTCAFGLGALSMVMPWIGNDYVAVLLMGFGIQPGQYFEPVTPADIAPTFAALCGIILSSRDGHVLAEALMKPRSFSSPPRTAARQAAKTNP